MRTWNRLQRQPRQGRRMALNPRDRSAGAVSGNMSATSLARQQLNACTAKVRSGCPNAPRSTASSRCGTAKALIGWDLSQRRTLRHSLNRAEEVIATPAVLVGVFTGRPAGSTGVGPAVGRAFDQAVGQSDQPCRGQNASSEVHIDVALCALSAEAAGHVPVIFSPVHRLASSRVVSRGRPAHLGGDSKLLRCCADRSPAAARASPGRRSGRG